MDSLQLAKSIAQYASKAKGIRIKVLDLRKLSSFTDFFVICSGISDRQMHAISDRVAQELKKENIRPLSMEGSPMGQWILVDFADVVLHVFNEESRTYYDLEGFWKRAPRVRLRLGKSPRRKSKRNVKRRS